MNFRLSPIKCRNRLLLLAFIQLSIYAHETVRTGIEMSCKARPSTVMLPTLVIGMAACLATAPASAAPISETINFNVSDFNAGAPVDPVIGSVSFTFDPSINNGSGPVTVNSLNLAYSTAVTYTYQQSIDRLVIGTGAAGAGRDSFQLLIRNASTTTTLQALGYGTASTDEVFASATGTVTVIREAVPEPATGVLLLSGLGALGLTSVGGFVRRQWDRTTAGGNAGRSRRSRQPSPVSPIPNQRDRPLPPA